MSANEKPSVRAARALFAERKLVRTLREVRADSFEDSAPIIARETGCDNLQSQFEEANRQILQLETERQSIAEENQRLRGLLQLLANGSNPLGGLFYQLWVRHIAREALKK